MLFDLEPYLPFGCFVVLVILTLGAIAAWGKHHDNNRNR